MKSCKHCKWANWKKTAAGKLHPSGAGQCEFVIRIPVLPKAFRWGFTTDKPNISGGFIDRHREWPEHCQTYSPADSRSTLVGAFKRAEVTP